MSSTPEPRRKRSFRSALNRPIRGATDAQGRRWFVRRRSDLRAWDAIGPGVWTTYATRAAALRRCLEETGEEENRE